MLPDETLSDDDLKFSCKDTSLKQGLTSIRGLRNSWCSKCQKLPCILWPRLEVRDPISLSAYNFFFLILNPIREYVYKLHFEAGCRNWEKTFSLVSCTLWIGIYYSIVKIYLLKLVLIKQIFLKLRLDGVVTINGNSWIAEPYIVSCSFSFNEIIVKGTREGEC